MSSHAKLGDVVKNVPNALYWLLGVCFVAVIAAFLVLAETSKNSDDFTRFLNTVMNFVGLLVGGGGALLAGSAAKSAHEARDAARQGNADTAPDQRVE
jgi:hypothetical protein